ncbi:carotenoid oxygenase [Ilyonectria robusta]|uniref:carotenoid oxygenase n=1 Tax=Ilyonectria robusta TaxID=1079257 RepID=UPI001E8EAAF5|nr:carotenoid oxygenase [Ilyonectria robusta]KAH8656344.1 carotenoid oxygenase [Ilyonectria robusta]
MAGFNRPTRFEGEMRNLEVVGTIPKSIAGTYFRVMPEPYHVPFWLNGDGAVSSFRIKDGNIDFKQRFVRTEKFRIEGLANRALVGKYRNPYTDLVEFLDRTTANTTVIPFKNVILALKEDSRPYALDPRTLETIGVFDFDGQLESETFTAHPKYDATTRELLAFGYEGKGIGTPDNFYMSIDEHGRFTEKVWFKAPFCAFQHDMAFTDNWVIFPLGPLECIVDNLKKGGNHWLWTDRGHAIGILPRRGAKSSDIKWFEGPNWITGHVANAWEQDGKVHVQIGVSKENGFGFFPDKDGKCPPQESPGVAPYLHEWVIDPHSDKLKLDPPTQVIPNAAEFPRIDDRVMGKKQRFTYGNLMDFTPGVTDWEYSKPLMGKAIGHMNTLYMHDRQTGEVKKYHRGPRHFFQEPQFIPRYPEAPEGDGYLVALVSDFDAMASELVVIDCDDFENHVALAKLPVRLRPGFHGSWVDDVDIEGRPEPAAGFTLARRPLAKETQGGKVSSIDRIATTEVLYPSRSQRLSIMPGE